MTCMKVTVKPYGDVYCQQSDIGHLLRCCLCSRSGTVTLWDDAIPVTWGYLRLEMQPTTNLMCCCRPDKQDKEAAFREFQTQVDDQLRQVAADEEVEAVDAALDREEREAFEQQSRLQHIQELKAWKSGDGKARPAVDIDDAIAAAMPKAKRQRVIDALQEVLGEGGGESSEGADEGDDELLDWRAKAV